MRIRVIVIIATLACARAAFAQATLAPPTSVAPVAPLASPVSASQEPSSSGREAALAVGQTIASGAAVGLMISAASSLSFDDGAALLYVLAPVASGLAVCSLGRLSSYESNCGNSTFGGYLGALAGGAIGNALAPKDGHGPGDILAYMAVGAVAGTMFGATAGWHLGRRPRAQPPAPTAAPALPPLSDAWPELRRRPALAASSDPGARRLMFPLVALSF